MEVLEAVSEYEQERGKPMPSANHSAVQGCLTGAFLRYADEYSILPELSLELGGRPFVPDLSVYPRLELDPLHDEPQKTDPPHMVVEILSPRQVFDDLVQKADAYLEAGVKSCWIVQPAIQAITVLVSGQPARTVASGELTDPPTGITVQLDDVFRPFRS